MIRMKLRRQPVIVLAAVDPDFQAAQCQRDKAGADIVERRCRLFPCTRSSASPRANCITPKNVPDPDRDVDQEDPVPGIGVGQPTADHRPDDRRDDDGDGGQRERLLSLLRRKMIQDDRLLRRLQAAAEKALQRAEQQDLPEIGRDAAGKRSHRERADADQEITLAAQPAARAHRRSSARCRWRPDTWSAPTCSRRC